MKPDEDANVFGSDYPLNDDRTEQTIFCDLLGFLAGLCHVYERPVSLPEPSRAGAEEEARRRGEVTTVLLLLEGSRRAIASLRLETIAALTLRRDPAFPDESGAEEGNGLDFAVPDYVHGVRYSFESSDPSGFEGPRSGSRGSCAQNQKWSGWEVCLSYIVCVCRMGVANKCQSHIKSNHREVMSTCLDILCRLVSYDFHRQTTKRSPTDSRAHSLTPSSFAHTPSTSRARAVEILMGYDLLAILIAELRVQVRLLDGKSNFGQLRAREHERERQGIKSTSSTSLTPNGAGRPLAMGSQSAFPLNVSSTDNVLDILKAYFSLLRVVNDTVLIRKHGADTDLQNTVTPSKTLLLNFDRCMELADFFWQYLVSNADAVTYSRESHDSECRSLSSHHSHDLGCRFLFLLCVAELTRLCETLVAGAMAQRAMEVQILRTLIFGKSALVTTIEQMRRVMTISRLGGDTDDAAGTCVVSLNRTLRDLLVLALHAVQAEHVENNALLSSPGRRSPLAANAGKPTRPSGPRETGIFSQSLQAQFQAALPSEFDPKAGEGGGAEGGLKTGLYDYQIDCEILVELYRHTTFICDMWTSLWHIVWCTSWHSSGTTTETVDTDFESESAGIVEHRRTETKMPGSIGEGLRMSGKQRHTDGMSVERMLPARGLCPMLDLAQAMDSSRTALGALRAVRLLLSRVSLAFGACGLPLHTGLLTKRLNRLLFANSGLGKTKSQTDPSDATKNDPSPPALPVALTNGLRICGAIMKTETPQALHALRDSSLRTFDFLPLKTLTRIRGLLKLARAHNGDQDPEGKLVCGTLPEWLLSEGSPAVDREERCEGMRARLWGLWRKEDENWFNAAVMLVLEAEALYALNLLQVGAHFDHISCHISRHISRLSTMPARIGRDESVAPRAEGRGLKLRRACNTFATGVLQSPPTIEAVNTFPFYRPLLARLLPFRAAASGTRTKAAAITSITKSSTSTTLSRPSWLARSTDWPQEGFASGGARTPTQIRALGLDTDPLTAAAESEDPVKMLLSSACLFDTFEKLLQAFPSRTTISDSQANVHDKLFQTIEILTLHLAEGLIASNDLENNRFAILKESPVFRSLQTSLISFFQTAIDSLPSYLAQLFDSALQQATPSNRSFEDAFIYFRFLLRSRMLQRAIPDFHREISEAAQQGLQRIEGNSGSNPFQNLEALRTALSLFDPLRFRSHFDIITSLSRRLCQELQSYCIVPHSAASRDGNNKAQDSDSLTILARALFWLCAEAIGPAILRLRHPDKQDGEAQDGKTQGGEQEHGYNGLYLPTLMMQKDVSPSLMEWTHLASDILATVRDKLNDCVKFSSSSEAEVLIDATHKRRTVFWLTCASLIAIRLEREPETREPFSPFSYVRADELVPCPDASSEWNRKGVKRANDSISVVTGLETGDTHLSAAPPRSSGPPQFEFVGPFGGCPLSVMPRLALHRVGSTFPFEAFHSNKAFTKTDQRGGDRNDSLAFVLLPEAFCSHDDNPFPGQSRYSDFVGICLFPFPPLKLQEHLSKANKSEFEMTIQLGMSIRLGTSSPFVYGAGKLDQTATIKGELCEETSTEQIRQTTFYLGPKSRFTQFVAGSQFDQTSKTWSLSSNDEACPVSLIVGGAPRPTNEEGVVENASEVLGLTFRLRLRCNYRKPKTCSPQPKLSFCDCVICSSFQSETQTVHGFDPGSKHLDPLPHTLTPIRPLGTPSASAVEQGGKVMRVERTGSKSRSSWDLEAQVRLQLIRAQNSKPSDENCLPLSAAAGKYVKPLSDRVKRCPSVRFGRIHMELLNALYTASFQSLPSSPTAASRIQRVS